MKIKVVSIKDFDLIATNDSDRAIQIGLLNHILTVERPIELSGNPEKNNVVQLKAYPIDVDNLVFLIGKYYTHKGIRELIKELEKIAEHE